MLFLLITSVILLLIFITGLLDDDTTGEDIYTIIITTLAVIFVIYIIIGMWIAIVADTEFILSSSVDIYELNDGDYYRRTLDDKIIYKTVENTELGLRITSSRTEIKYTEDNPRIETYYQRYKNELVRKNFINIGFLNKKILYIKE